MDGERGVGGGSGDRGRGVWIAGGDLQEAGEPCRMHYVQHSVACESSSNLCCGTYAIPGRTPAIACDLFACPLQTDRLGSHSLPSSMMKPSVRWVPERPRCNPRAVPESLRKQILFSLLVYQRSDISRTGAHSQHNPSGASSKFERQPEGSNQNVKRSVTVLWYSDELKESKFTDLQSALAFTKHLPQNAPHQILDHGNEHSREPKDSFWPPDWPTMWPVEGIYQQLPAWDYLNQILFQRMQDLREPAAAKPSDEVTFSGGTASAEEDSLPQQATQSPKSSTEDAEISAVAAENSHEVVSDSRTVDHKQTEDSESQDASRKEDQQETPPPEVIHHQSDFNHPSEEGETVKDSSVTAAETVEGTPVPRKDQENSQEGQEEGKEKEESKQEAKEERKQEAEEEEEQEDDMGLPRYFFWRQDLIENFVKEFLIDMRSEDAQFLEKFDVRQYIDQLSSEIERMHNLIPKQGGSVLRKKIRKVCDQIITQWKNQMKITESMMQESKQQAEPKSEQKAEEQGEKVSSSSSDSSKQEERHPIGSREQLEGQSDASHSWHVPSSSGEAELTHGESESKAASAEDGEAAAEKQQAAGLRAGEDMEVGESKSEKSRESVEAAGVKEGDGEGRQEPTASLHEYTTRAPAPVNSEPSTQEVPMEEELKFASGSLMDIFYNRCYVKEDGWWTYELCHGKNVTQFRRALNEAGEHLRVQGNLLGLWLQQYNPPEQPERDKVHHYMLGTACGAGAQLREAHVQFRCIEGKNAVGDRIDSIKEDTLCNYKITFLTHHACKSDAFTPQHDLVDPMRPQGASETEAEVPRTVTLIEDALALQHRIGIRARHCFNLDQACSMSFWLWLHSQDMSPEVIGERSIFTVKEPMYTVSPHLLWGFAQAPGLIFCGLHTIAMNQMVGSFSSKPIPLEQWNHITVVWHGPVHKRLDCVINGEVQTMVMAPSTLHANPKSSLTNLFVGGSPQFHPAASGVIAKVDMHHGQALDVPAILSLMSRGSQLPALLRRTDLWTGSSPVSLNPAASLRGVRQPQGNRTNSAMWFHINELFLGKEHALLALGHQHLLGLDGSSRSCQLAAAYYRTAAEIALRDLESPDAASVEFIRLSQEVEKGDAFAGHGGEDDDIFQYQETLAEAGDTRAQAWLGHRYYWGAGGVPRDRARALDYLQRAARDGNVEAQYNLGVMYAYGHGVPKDRNESLNLFRKAAAQGYVAALNGLALSLTDGSADNNLTEAFHYFNQSALSGNADGLYNAGLLLKDGRGVEKNEKLALTYMTNAVLLDHQAARLALAMMYIEGRGTPVSCVQGARLLKDAAERGKWGVLLRDGLQAYMKGDLDASLASYEAAAELGYEVAQSNAAWLYKQCAQGTVACLTRPEQALRRSYELLAMAAGNGNMEATRILGDQLWYGHGTSANRAKAMDYYLQAARGGDEEAAFNLAWAHLAGISGQQRNITRARMIAGEVLQARQWDLSSPRLLPFWLVWGASEGILSLESIIDTASYSGEWKGFRLPEAPSGGKQGIMISESDVFVSLLATLALIRLVQRLMLGPARQQDVQA
eukprot:756481-Hanusia_phi.AAC.8